MMTIPKVDACLPTLVQFTKELAQQNAAGTLTNWNAFIERVHAFYTSAVMNEIEQYVPGWKKMASYADQQTLIHVTSVLAALFLLPEYQQASPDQAALMVWLVLFHDVAKEAKRGEHDYIHAFRSAAIAGKALSRAGFPTTEGYTAQIDPWFEFTHNAIIDDPVHDEVIQDNTRLPEIVSGIDRLYGVNAPAGWVIKGVLFHLSIATDPDYPLLAPLTSDEIRRYIDAPTYLLLKVMMLVDNDGWNFFDPDKKRHYRQQTLAVFDRIARLIDARSG